MISSQHVYEVRPRKDYRGVDLIFRCAAVRPLWYVEPNGVIGYAKHRSRISSHSGMCPRHGASRLSGGNKRTRFAFVR
jgi:hypothetical protein